jgi:UDP-glucose 4-epimerase
MRVLVTGAAGFIGSHLVDRLLVEGDEVFGIDDMSSGQMSNLVDARRSGTGKFKFHRLDITSTALGEYVARTKPEIVFHLAAQVDVRKSVKDPIHDAMVNIVGTLNLLQESSRAGVKKVVFTSSGGCIYGEPDEAQIPVREELVFGPEAAPESPYGVSKKVVLDYFRYFRSVKGLDYTALALANVFGPRQEPAAEVGLEGQVVAIFCRKMLAGRPCTIYGDGTQTRDFIYVDDVTSALLAAREAGGGELLNIGSGTETSINELFAQLAELAHSRYEPIYGAARPGELQRIAVDASKAAQVLGWRANTALNEGLKHTVAWFRATS